MILEESFPKGGSMLDSQDAGAERPREMALLGRFSLLHIVGMNVFQHQGRQGLMHFWMKFTNTPRRRHVVSLANYCSVQSMHNGMPKLKMKAEILMTMVGNDV